VAKSKKTQRHHVVGQLRKHQPQEIQRYHGIELALTVEARAESVWYLFDAEISSRRGDDIQQDLEPLRRKLRREFFEAVAAHHEEAAHRIGNLDPQYALCNFSGESAGARPLLVETLGAAAGDIAAADQEIRMVGLQQFQHLGQLALIVLQVGINHCRAGCARCQNALDARTGQAPPSDPANAANTRVLPCKAAHHIPGFIGGIVIDEDDLPANASERAVQPPNQRRDIVALVEGRNNDGKLRCSNGLRRTFGPRSDGVVHAPAYIR